MSDGLTSQEAAARLAQHGPNEVVERPVNPLARIARHFWSPVPWMLELVIVLQAILRGYAEAMLIGAVLLFNVILGVVQEGRANAALELLKTRLSLSARVRRDGAWKELPARELVPDDVVQLSLGTVVPADVRITGGSLLVDQSMLTGESTLVDVTNGMTAYSGSLVRRGEATGIVIETGTATYFGRTAELVRTAHVETAEVKAVLGLVRNLSILNAGVIAFLVADAFVLALPLSQILLLVLTAMLSAVPVALPATFTLAAALGSRDLALKGVLLTRLSALNEAAGIDVLCADKTGTLTNDEITVAAVRPIAQGWSEADVLAYAAFASSADGRDPVDAAVCRAASNESAHRALPNAKSFTPFDPATKRAETRAVDAAGNEITVRKGAPEAFGALDASATAVLDELSKSGYRVLAVSSESGGVRQLLGFVALGDTPRSDSAELIRELRELGVQTTMVTGDREATAQAVAHEIGLDGRVYAGVFPEDKFRIVKELQAEGHAVGMCGDGANDAPALRQAQMGIAVSTATDVAKAAAGMVLTTPGLSGIVEAIREGRVVFQRVLTYTMTILVNKVVTLIVLGGGLLLTGHAVLTPLLQAISMFATDFVSMARTTDRARPSPHPNAWRLKNLTIAAIPLAVAKLVFCMIVLYVGVDHLHLGTRATQTLTFLMLAFAGQSITYVLRERDNMFSSMPSRWMIFFSTMDIVFVSLLAGYGFFMAPLPVPLILALFGATAAFALVLDRVKLETFRRLQID